MKAIKATLSRDLPYIEIHTFSDWHIGDVHCDMNEIRSEIAAVAENPHAFAILNGDLMNNATKTSVSDCYAEELTPQQQIETLCNLLDPISSKILMVTQGNHEVRTYRNDGIDLTGFVASKLGLVDKYAREGGVLFVRFGAESKGRHERGNPENVRMIPYSIYCTHGSGGGRKEGAKAIRLADMASIVDTDIYIHSHTHLPMVMKQSFYRVDSRNSSIACVEKLFVNTSAKLDYGGYGQSGEFKPSSKSNPVIILSGTKRFMTAKM